MHLKFDLAGVRTHDLQIISSTFHVHVMLSSEQFGLQGSFSDVLNAHTLSLFIALGEMSLERICLSI